MTITASATLENGQLKFQQPINLTEGIEVRVTITPVPESAPPHPKEQLTEPANNVNECPSNVAAEEQIPDSISRYADDPKSVFEFCVQHDALLPLKTAVHLVEKYFPTREKLSIRLEQDPEDGNTTIAVKVTVRDEVRNFRDAYNRCISAWGQDISPAGLGLIALSYDVL